MKFRKLLPLSTCILALASCGGESSSSTSEPPVLEKANGGYSFKYADGKERTEIFGKLEKYALDNHLSGLTLCGYGDYLLYQPSVVRGGESEIPSYGFGVLEEGVLTADLKGETDPDYRRYFHTAIASYPKASVPGKANFEEAINPVLYTNAAYFSKKTNASKDGYEWYGNLSTSNHPIAVNPNREGLATIYRVPVKVGEAFRYSTASARHAEYDGREVALEDYLTIFKIRFASAYQIRPSYDLLFGEDAILGIHDYYQGSNHGVNEELWKGVGIKAYENGGAPYLEFEFEKERSRVEALKLFSDISFAPIPEEFIKEIGGGDFDKGVATWGLADDQGTIIDHTLCTGPYRIEKWKESEIILQKSPYFEEKGRFCIEGIHMDIIADEADALAAFEANKLHVVTVPVEDRGEYFDDPRLVYSADVNHRKLNLNTCDKAMWEKLFGENGTIVQTPKEKYWNLKPAMANDDFVRGLSHALDRLALAKELRQLPAADFLPSSFLLSAEDGVAYNRSQAHRDAVSSMMDGTDGYGYSIKLAQEEFKKATASLIADGSYKEGDTIEIEIAWNTKDQIEAEHALIAGMLESTFNELDLPLKLKATSWVGKTWSDAYYQKMEVGQFDIGYGTISSSVMDFSRHYFENLRSDNASGFTLNWGVDTNVCDEELGIEHDGEYFSFDALWIALSSYLYSEKGQNASLFEVNPELSLAQRKEDGSLVIEGQLKSVSIANDGVADPETIEDYEALGTLEKVAIFGANDSQGTGYVEEAIPEECITLTPGNGYYNTVFRIDVPKDICRRYEAFTGCFGFDFYETCAILGHDFSGYASSILIEGGMPA